ncbi:MAG: undecaprenyldiphospho-muramoylpentapeptide beta-N-acetylglucosaminyltransferase [Eubacteriales bacterium]
MRVLMSGGGTAGHVTPALAIASHLKRRNKDTEIAFVGTKKGIENKLVAREGYELYHVDVKGISRSLTLSNISAVIKAYTSRFAARKIIKSFKPDLVVGTGGYASWPVLSAAASMGIPTAVHESNAYPGITAKLLSRSVDAVMMSFEESRKYFAHPERCLLTGNPVRAEMLNADREKSREKLGITRPFLFSYGGSMGAQRINEVMLEVMSQYSSKKDMLHILVTGSIEYKDTKRQFEERGLDKYENLKLLEYVYDMPDYLSAADLVVCRAGAMTVSELAVLSKPAIFIPSPNVTENHQYKNAKAVADKGGGVVVEEKDLNATDMVARIDALLYNPDALMRMGRMISRFARYDSIDVICDTLTALASGKK